MLIISLIYCCLRRLQHYINENDQHHVEYKTNAMCLSLTYINSIKQKLLTSTDRFKEAI